jgi:glycosyltransferase involved in cell wall biosynthesis
MHAKPLIIIDSATVGGPGRGLFQLLKGLKERELPYRLCTFSYRKPKSLELVHKARENGFELSEIPQYFTLDPLPIWHLGQLLKRGGFNLIQSHGYKSHLMAAILSRVFNVPWVAFAHGWTAENFKVKMYHKLDLFLLRKAAAVIAVSPPLQSKLAEIRNGKPTELILNAVDPAAIPGDSDGHAVRNELGLKDEFVIGCFGRLSHEKGQDILIRAFAKSLFEVDRRLKLLFLGDGPAKKDLLELSDKLGVKDKIIFKSHVTNIKGFYSAIDLLILPSRSEGLPNVVLEAMACGVPVAAAEVGAVSQIITNNVNGWIFKAGDEIKLSKIIEEAVTENGKLNKIAMAGKESLMPKFCPLNRVEKILGVYRQTLDSFFQFSTKTRAARFTGS